MNGHDRATWFAGDLDDPWVVEIADALPRDTLRFDCPADLPETWPTDRAPPMALVLHRSTLSVTDAQRVARLRSRAERMPRVVLCVGPHARYVDVECWSRLVDAVIPEATASEIIRRQALLVERRPRPTTGPRPKVTIASSNFETRATWVEVARSGGYAVEPVADPFDSASALPIAWDVPVLEPDWPTRLANLARTRPVLALLGFADRQTVIRARQAGASACLDLPCEISDFLAVIDRLASIRHDPAHELPPSPTAKHAKPARRS